MCRKKANFINYHVLPDSFLLNKNPCYGIFTQHGFWLNSNTVGKSSPINILLAPYLLFIHPIPLVAEIVSCMTQ